MSNTKTVHVLSKRWLTPKDMVEEFEFSLDYQSKLRTSNKIPYSKLGTKKVLYDRRKINKWLESHNIEVRVS